MFADNRKQHFIDLVRRTLAFEKGEEHPFENFYLNNALFIIYEFIELLSQIVKNTHIKI